MSSSPYLELSCLVILVLPASCLPSHPALRLCKCRPLRATHRARHLPLPMMDVMIISFVLLSLRAPLPPSRAPLRRLLSSASLIELLLPSSTHVHHPTLVVLQPSTALTVLSTALVLLALLLNFVVYRSARILKLNFSRPSQCTIISMLRRRLAAVSRSSSAVPSMTRSCATSWVPAQWAAPRQLQVARRLVLPVHRQGGVRLSQGASWPDDASYSSAGPRFFQS